MFDESLVRRAGTHAALADPTRLRIVDRLGCGDLSAVDLRRELAIESNLLAHHLDVLQHAGLLQRRRSDGDGRRRYLKLLHEPLGALALPTSALPADRVVFVCTANSARSQLAAALWSRRTGRPAASAGTRPAAAVHPDAVRAARRAGLEIGDAHPRSYDALPADPADVVVSVCDLAWEAGPPPGRVQLHWSVPDPVAAGDDATFDAVLEDLTERTERLAVTAGMGEGPTT